MTLIACVQIANLPIARARRDNTALMAQPLIIYVVEHGRAHVSAASGDAGVTVGMPLHRARARCPQAMYLPAEPEQDAQTAAALAALLGAFSPRVAEAVPLPDLAFTLDLGKVAIAQVMTIVDRIAHRVRAELGLAAAIGVAANRLAAQHAARRAGVGVALLIPPGQEQVFLAPQPVETLDLDAALVERISRLGLRTVGELARVPLDALQTQFGGVGQQLYQLARGIDTLPIPTTADAPTISATQRFVGPLLNVLILERAIEQLATRLDTQLAKGGWAAGAVAVTLALDDGKPVVVERMLAEPTSDRARLAAALLGLARGAVLGSGVTSITAAASHLTPVVVEQLELFAPAGGQAARLRDVLSRLEGRFGGSLLRVRLADPEARLPERRVRLNRR